MAKQLSRLMNRKYLVLKNTKNIRSRGNYTKK